LAQGVTVSTISITDEQASLENLGQVADLSGGQVDRVDPLKLTENFTGILEQQVIATGVLATMLLHNGLQFRSVDDDDTKSKEKDEKNTSITNRLSKTVGNAFEDSEIFFEYTIKSDEDLKAHKDLTSLPFQVQIHYTRLDGSKCIRIISQRKEITHKTEEAEKDVDVAIVAANAAQRSARLAQKGDYEGSRLNNVAWRGVLNRTAQNTMQNEEVRGWSEKTREFDDMLHNLQNTETVEGLGSLSRGSATIAKKTRSSRRTDEVSAAMYKMKKMSSPVYRSPGKTPISSTLSPAPNYRNQPNLLPPVPTPLISPSNNITNSVSLPLPSLSSSTSSQPMDLSSDPSSSSIVSTSTVSSSTETPISSTVSPPMPMTLSSENLSSENLSSENNTNNSSSSTSANNKSEDCIIA